MTCFSIITLFTILVKEQKDKSFPRDSLFSIIDFFLIEIVKIIIVKFAFCNKN